MIRFVLSPEGVVTPDLRRKLPGRGAWVSLSRARVEEAAKRALFTKAFKAPARTPPDLADLIDRLLVEDALGALRFANKAGVVTSGAVKVEAALQGGRVVAILSASDAAEDGRRKLRQAARRHGAETALANAFDCFSSAQMSLCLGRENVIHAVLSASAVADGFVGKCRRLLGFRGAIANTDGHGPDPQSGPGLELFSDTGSDAAGTPASRPR
jgi:predicted RNA-binding protein YlxR (DUF448 family)